MRTGHATCVGLAASLVSLASSGLALPYKRVSLLPRTTDSDSGLSNIDSTNSTSSSSSSSNGTDTLVLNFALTFEALEAAYYAAGLGTYSVEDFAGAGLAADVRGRMAQIGLNEAAHARLLNETLGASAGRACNYAFSFAGPDDFVKTAAVFETLGASVYTELASLLTDSQHMTDIAAILATEARQSAYLNGQVEGFNPWNTPFETPLTMNQAWTLASSFITSCPSSNPTLFTTTFPSLTASTTYTAGSNVTLQFNASASNLSTTTTSSNSTSDSDSDLYLTFLTGLGTLTTPIASTDASQNLWSALLPAALGERGTVYGIVTSSNASTADADTVAGVVVFQFPYNASVTQGL